jgi:outer membrane murein-binding lipoprotein Lpp
MKTMKGILLMTAVMALVAFGCSNRESEKKIAQLESRLQELEGKKAAPAPAAVTPETQAADVKPTGPLPALEFETVDHDFGTIKEGDVVEYTYKFKNTGEAPLIIQGAQGSCGCTVPEWSKEPIQVGGTGFVKAKFDSQGKPNTQNKTVTVTANTWPKQTVLRFKAMVLPKAATPDSGPVKK